jgi:hypothetical protein
MVDRPVKQSPALDRVEKTMRSMSISQRGFLGRESRKLVEILTEDQGTVHSLGLSHEVIAQRLRTLTEAARDAWGEPVVVEERFEVRLVEARGKIPCPWGHPGLYPKTHVVLKDTRTGESLVWSDLALHLIEEHGFYQGRGSPYRLEPRTIKRVFDL